MEKISPCPHCGSKEIYRNKRGISGGGYAANYLPGLGGFLHHARLYPTICADCGLTRFFVDGKSRARLSGSPKWEKIRKF